MYTCSAAVSACARGSEWGRAFHCKKHCFWVSGGSRVRWLGPGGARILQSGQLGLSRHAMTGRLEDGFVEACCFPVSCLPMDEKACNKVHLGAWRKEAERASRV